MLTLGNEGSAEFVIEDGAYVLSGYARLGRSGNIDASGNHIGSYGAMTIDGSASHWRNADDLYIGDSGSARIEITNGGSLHSRDGFLGYGATGLGEVRLSGADSWWEVAESLHAGYAGEGELTIENGASVSVRDDVSIQTNAGASGKLNIFASATTAIEAGSNGTGNFINNGIVRLMATPGIPAGGYTPITVGATEGSFSGTGLYQAFGGIWDTGSETFTASGIVDSADDTISDDLSGRRYYFDLGKVAVGFPHDAGVAAFSIAPLEVPGMNLEKTLGAYSIASDANALPLLLSIYVGTDFAVTELSFQTRGASFGAWEYFAPSAYGYHDGWASFVVEDPGDYAVAYHGYSDTLTAYRDIYGLATDGADDLADWSRDGLPNLFSLAFALGDPNHPATDRSGLPSIDSADSEVSISFLRLDGTNGDILDYTLLTSDDLATWYEVASSAIALEIVAGLSGPYERVTLVLPTSGETRFYRLAITAASK